jgi:uncharacterized protein (DUF1800 family)
MTDVVVDPVGVNGLPKASAAAPLLAGLAAPRATAAGRPRPTAAEASRFLAQASIGASHSEFAAVQKVGYAAWIDQQMALPPSRTRWDWLVAGGFADIANQNSENGFDAAAWVKILTSPDTLRQRITLALSEILVVSVAGLTPGGWKAFSAARYLDLLEANAFGNYRALLQAVSTSVPMGQYLTFRGNAKANPTSGALPDENYARELMQLFTIGLVRLNADGTPALVDGAPVETYAQTDITGLARVFTGWDFDYAGVPSSVATQTPDFVGRPMGQVPSRHELGTKSFLGTTIPAGTDGAKSLPLALDAIFAHPNVGPFVCKQLIQRLVTSNPSPAYVGRVAAVFDNDGSGARGNLQAVVKALLLDAEARTPAASPAYGKVREPILRLAGWARAFSVTSASNAWGIGNTSDPASRLGQSPLRAGSVFNFFRPGYVPPSSELGSQGLVAPELQITNESTVAGYVNFMQRAVAGTVGDVKANYSGLLTLANDAQALLDELNLVLAANQLGAPTIAALKAALATMRADTAAALQNRVYAALVMVLAAPEYIVQK